MKTELPLDKQLSLYAALLCSALGVLLVALPVYTAVTGRAPAVASAAHPGFQATFLLVGVVLAAIGACLYRRSR